MENILEVKGISKDFRKAGFQLSDISFTVPYGAVTGLIGENGAGKTTLLRTIMNVYSRTSGEITGFDGIDNVKDEAEFKERTGFVSDENYLYPEATVRETARAFSAAFRDWDQSVFDKLVSGWKINLSQKCGNLSKGIRTKVMMALSLAHKPELLILDEATAGLDPSSRREFLDIIRDFTADGEHSVLMSTHITGDLDRIADYIVFMDAGRIKETISADEFQEKYIYVSGTSAYVKSEPAIGPKVSDNTYEAIALRKNADKFHCAEIRNATYEEYLVHMMEESRRSKTEAGK